MGVSVPDIGIQRWDQFWSQQRFFSVSKSEPEKFRWFQFWSPTKNVIKAHQKHQIRGRPKALAPQPEDLVFLVGSGVA